MELEAAVAVGLPPASYRALPFDDRAELEAYFLLRRLKVIDENQQQATALEKMKREREMQQKMHDEAPQVVGHRISSRPAHWKR
jgi:hypothetical protein